MVQNFENQNTQDVLPFKGKITTVMYYEPETGFAIFKIRQEGETKSSTAKGYVPNPVAGAKIFYNGTWKEDQKFGGYYIAISNSKIDYAGGGKDAIIELLSSDFVPGVGPTVAKKIVDHFGKDALQVIEREPERLKEISGIGVKSADRIHEGYMHIANDQELIALLLPYLSIQKINFVIKKFGTGKMALEEIKENPYVLYQKFSGIGFATADKVALGGCQIARDDIRRVTAILLYALETQAQMAGNTFIWVDDMYRVVKETMRNVLHEVAFPDEVIRKAATIAREDSLVVVQGSKPTDGRKPMFCMLNAYIGLLRKTALSVGITRRFFVVIEFQKTISNDGSRFELVVADLNAMAANVRSHMEQCGNVFIPALGNPDRNEDAGIHQLFYQLLNRSKSETVSFHDHMQPIIDRYSEAEMQGVKTSLQAPELIAPEWIDFTHYNYIVIDGKFYTFAYIPSTGYNQRVYAGWIATFVNAGEGIDVDMFFEHMSREAVYNKISTQLRMSRANAMDSHDTDSDYHARMEKISSSEYMLRGLSTGEDFYYMSMVITVVADSVDELEYKYDNLEKRVKGQGMKIRRANFMMEECFESALLPLGKLNKDIKRKAQRNVLTSGVASCYPFISFEMQDPDGIMIGTNRANNSLVTIDMFDTDVHANANAVILGSTGYGKTFTAQLFALRLSEMDTQVFIISPLKGLEDYGGGCKAVGGQFISMDPSSVNSINIMDIRVPDDEDAKKMDDYETTGSLLTKKIHTVKSFLHLVVKDMTQEEEQLIDTSLYKVYGRFGITNDNDSIFDLENGGYKKMPLLEDLQKEMQNVPELHRICNILNPLIRGSMACYNRPTNVDLKAKYIVFDFNGMKGPTLTMSMFVVLDFVWTKIKEDRAKRKAVFIDECWKLIGTDSNEMAAEDVVEIFRTIRAYGGSAFAMTQDISQFYEYKGGKYGKAVIGNADTKIIMHLIPSEAKALQAAIQLTDSEMENVSNLGRGQGLVCSGAAKLFVDFIAAPYEKQEITTDAKSFYLQEKALKEKQHKEEQERLAAEKANSNTDANDDDADLLNVTF